jgi:hypothetical protein
MIVCPLPLRVVEREAIVPGTADDENNAADLPVTVKRLPLDGRFTTLCRH